MSAASSSLRLFDVVGRPLTGSASSAPHQAKRTALVGLDLAPSAARSRAAPREPGPVVVDAGGVGLGVQVRPGHHDVVRCAPSGSAARTLLGGCGSSRSCLGLDASVSARPCWRTPRPGSRTPRRRGCRPGRPACRAKRSYRSALTTGSPLPWFITTAPIAPAASALATFCAERAGAALHAARSCRSTLLMPSGDEVGRLAAGGAMPAAA